VKRKKRRRRRRRGRGSLEDALSMAQWESVKKAVK
jgi:hypothetical protein